MPLMNNITKTLKETFKPRKRRAAIGGILGPIMIVVIVIAGVGVLAAMFFDLADTASIVDSIEISNQAIYSEQGFVTVQVKNGGNTAIDHIHAVLLVTDHATSPTTASCSAGTDPLNIGSDPTGNAEADLNLITLNPGESVTISGGLRDVGTLNSAGVFAAGAGTQFVCDDTLLDALVDREEYILQINGFSGTDPISKTITTRAR